MITWGAWTIFPPHVFTFMDTKAKSRDFLRVFASASGTADVSNLCRNAAGSGPNTTLANLSGEGSPGHNRWLTSLRRSSFCPCRATPEATLEW
ncbi:Uncharacterised protein [Mycobacteroides abscessus subsp. abscessus]|nr:Uncharacterised protein [Mycobacteroides abscessus subsp. abscessus]